MIARSLRLSFCAPLVVLGIARAAAAASPTFPEPVALRTQVKFWQKIFGVYSQHQIVFHDPENLARVYSVLDFRDRVAAGDSPLVIDVVERDAMVQERQRIREVLLRLDARQGNTGGLDDEERKVWDLFGKDKDPSRFALAADPARIRTQRGLRERFAEGVRISRRYLGEMEEVFRREGLPTELTRLPLVESCFDIEAYSKVGAAGIWQFMPSTGRNYMSIAGVVDERRDPLRATRGAALHLKENYEVLGSWPLAITAYNHGRAGIARAVSRDGKLRHRRHRQDATGVRSSGSPRGTSTPSSWPPSRSSARTRITSATCNSTRRSRATRSSSPTRSGATSRRAAPTFPPTSSRR